MASAAKPLVKLPNILFIDVKTVPEYPNLQAAPPMYAAFWRDSYRKFDLPQPPFASEEEENKFFLKNAGTLPEFSRIVTVGLGYFTQKSDNLVLRCTAIEEPDEPKLLERLCKTLDKHGKDGRIYALCAHNGREFDYPFIARRFLINNMPLPKSLSKLLAKPWDSPHIDTLEMWRFGARRGTASLPKLAWRLKIDHQLSQRASNTETFLAWHLGKDVPPISQYAIEDVILTAKLWLRLSSTEIEQPIVVEKV